MFVTTAEFLPQHRTHRGQIIELITAAQARGQTRLAEMNQQVLGNLDRIIDTLDHDADGEIEGTPMRADNTHHLTEAARRRARTTRRRAVAALRRMHTSGLPVTIDALAREARVSRSWIYSQPDLRAEAARLRDRPRPATGRAVPDRQRASDASLLRRVEIATQRIRELETDNKRLRDALAEALGEQRHRARRPTTPRHAETTSFPPIRTS